MSMRRVVLLCVAAAVAVRGQDGEETQYRPEAPTEGTTVFYETFQEKGEANGLGAFVRSENEKYKNQVAKIVDETDGLEGDRSMSFAAMARHYAVTAPFEASVDLSDGTFVAQYEVRWPKTGDECGGAYIKLYSENGLPSDLAEVDGSTPYTIMFGPDKCGTTSKIHFILRHKNPVTGEYGEHHLKSPPGFKSSWETQTFAIVVRPDDTYAILVNNVVEKEGSLLEDLEPPLNPEKMIEDPEDTKPEDWVDDAKIPNPFATKPDDWDEDAPAQIPDPDATMPDGWEEEEESFIPDPDASQPEDWDEEEDGEWEAPVVKNPKCSVGCGTWKAPMMRNPAYKGKWSPPLMDNPDYKGPWKPRVIENPKYFSPLDNFVSNEDGKGFDEIAALGIEVWTMKSGTRFDNFLITNSESAARAFAESTATLKTARQLESRRAEEKSEEIKALEGLRDGSFLGFVSYAIGMVQVYPIRAACTGFVLVIVNMFVLRSLCDCCCGGSRAPEGSSLRREPVSAQADAKETTARTEKKSSAVDDDKAKGKAGNGDGTDVKKVDTDEARTVSKEKRKKRSARRSPRMD
eukprot:g3456.t1